EAQGGLTDSDANELIRFATDRIFKWTGAARDHRLYTDLCESGFKIAADIACFESHHLNHLTPNTLCMDLYTAAMKRCMGEMTSDAFRERVEAVLTRFCNAADHDYLRLSFKHLSAAEVDSYQHTALATNSIQAAADTITHRLAQPDLDLTKL